MEKLNSVISRALAEVRRTMFLINQRTNEYADLIKSFTTENNNGVLDVAYLSDENSGAIVDLAEYIDEVKKNLDALKDDMDMISHYAKLLEDRAINDLTGNVWSITDIDLTWRDKVYTRIYSDGYYLDEDGTAYKANPT